jgi:hypothetical protein
MPGTKVLRWDDNCRETVMAAHAALVSDGLTRPTIRSVLYKLLELPSWDKRHYDHLTVMLGKWGDAGLVEFGLFSDDGAGAAKTPLTTRQIAEQLRMWKDTIPARMGTDGKLHVLLVEHVSLVEDLSDWLDNAVPIVSCQGQLRREILHRAVREWFAVVSELTGVTVNASNADAYIDVVALVDYDKGGRDIHGAIARWLRDQAGLNLRLWGVTEAQVKAAGLPTHETHQIDGWIARYRPSRVKQELRKALGVQN